MADPITLMAAGGMAATAAGGIIGGLGAESSGQSQQAMYNYKAGVAQLNKQIADQNASWAVQSGGIQAEEKGLQSGQAIAETKVAQSGSNLDVNSGSPAAVRKTQTDVAQFDQNVIKWDAAKTAWGYEAKAAGDTAEANLDIMAGETAKTAGDIGMVTSFLNAGASVASKWSQGKTAGMSLPG
jgi:hypothetical protein